MPFDRSCGVLMPVVSLASTQGIGTLGKESLAFIDFLHDSRHTWWQMLPIGPTGYGDSPYQTFSVFAGNPLWIDMLSLSEHGLLTPEEIEPLLMAPADHVDYGYIVPVKNELLRKACTRFDGDGTADYTEFLLQNAHWLYDYSLFAALKEENCGKPWWEWEPGIRNRQEDALNRANERLAHQAACVRFVQYMFFKQWGRLRDHARDAGIKLMGDMPIFTSMDSAEAWAYPELFLFDEEKNPLWVAGVPPDLFSATGQLWGNPLYNWEFHRLTGYKWWLSRFGHVLGLFDAARIDHFRGFAAAWHVPAGEVTAQNGKWVKAPGDELFTRVFERFTNPCIVAEDLGVITPDVKELRLKYKLPGMKILQFAFSNEADNPYLPVNIEPNSVVYCGTHDNETTLGWFNNLDKNTLAQVKALFGAQDGKATVEAMLNAMYSSKADLCVCTLADHLLLDNQARINHPGIAGGNWGWRIKEGSLETNLRARLADFARLSRRAGQ